jgi:predicted small secreted protein
MTIVRLCTICVLVSALFTASCANTVRGVGRDIKSTANAVEDVVEP